MSNDLLSSNRPTSSTSLSDNNGNQGNKYNETIIGQQFASSIILADLAIKSTAYMPPPSTSTAVALDDTNGTKKSKRRVTFKDDIQVQMIPVYSSCSSASSSSEDLALPEEPETVAKPIPAPTIIPSERISKKATYDALQYRKEVRRRDNNSFQPSSSRSAFWYPLNPPATTTTTNNGMIRHPLPTLRSLEMTERLISESIERQMALYPNLRQQDDDSSSNEVDQPNEDILSSPSSNINNNTNSILIIDSDDEEEEQDPTEDFTTYDDRPNIEHQSSTEDEQEDDDFIQTRLEIAELEKTPSLENDSDYREPITLKNEHSTMQTSANSMYIEDSDTSTTSSVSPLPLPPSSPPPTTTHHENDNFEDRFQPEDVISSFEKYSPPKLTLPFEEKFISISTKSTTTAITTPTFNHSAHRLFFIKVLKAEQLDFPIENGKEKKKQEYKQ